MEESTKNTNQPDILNIKNKSRVYGFWAIPASVIILGLSIAYLYHWGGFLHRFTQGISGFILMYIGNFAMYLLAGYAVLRGGNKVPRKVTFTTVLCVLFFAIFFRVQLSKHPPYLSTDAYRYVWDGRVQSAGINPYKYSPDSPELEYLRDDVIYPKINRPGSRTPYPPVGQAIFNGVYSVRPLSVQAFKATISCFDIITTLALMLLLWRAGMNPARAIIYAWHPLVLWEGAHSGHIDGAFIAFIVLAFLAWSYKKQVLAGSALALAAMVKFYPAILLLLFFKPISDNSGPPPGSLPVTREDTWMRRVTVALLDWKGIKLVLAFILTIIIAYIPYWPAGLKYISNELQEEGFVDEGKRFFILGLIRKLVHVPTNVYLMVAVLTLVGLGVWWVFRSRRSVLDLAGCAMTMIGLFLILTSPRYPWYFLWIIPFLCLVPRVGWMYLTGVSVLLYLTWFKPDMYPHIPLWMGLSIYLPATVLLIWDLYRSGRTNRINSRFQL